MSLSGYREALVPSERASANFVALLSESFLQGLEYRDRRLTRRQARRKVSVRVQHHFLGLQPSKNLFNRRGCVCCDLFRFLLVVLLDCREDYKSVFEGSLLVRLIKRLRFFDCFFASFVFESVCMNQKESHLFILHCSICLSFLSFFLSSL